MKSKKLVSLISIGAMLAGVMTGCGAGDSSSSVSSVSEQAATTKAQEGVEVQSVSSESISRTASSSAVDSDTSAAITLSDGDGDGYKIALIPQHQTNAYQILIAESAQAEADRVGAELTILSADQDAAKQISEIEQCISENYDAIIFEPVDPDALGDVAQQAADAGIVVVNITSACTDWKDHGISAVSMGDNKKAGEVEMQNIADALDGKGNIAILTGPSGDSTGLARMDGYNAILEKYPDITQVVEPADCSWDTAQAQATVESWLSAYDLDAIVCENDGMAVGAGNAAGTDSGIIIAGIDATPDGFEAIEDGRITATVSQNGKEIAVNAIDAAVSVLRGDTLQEREILTENIWIDKSNISDYE